MKVKVRDWVNFIHDWKVWNPKEFWEMNSFIIYNCQLIHFPFLYSTFNNFNFDDEIYIIYCYLSCDGERKDICNVYRDWKDSKKTLLEDTPTVKEEKSPIKENELEEIKAYLKKILTILVDLDINLTNAR